MRLPLDAEALIRKHAARGVAMDSNLLVLLILGRADRTQIGRHKRTSSYDADDFALLQNVVAKFQTIIVTPHALTQADDLLGARNPKDALHRQIAAAFVDQSRVAREERDPASELVRDRSFPRFGLADAGLMQLAERGTLVITDDRKLADEIVTRGYDAINFAHLRSPYLIR
jgi:hypothetical protein